MILFFALIQDGLIASPEAGWPQWRGPRRDGVSDEKGLLQTWPEGGPKQLWKVEGLGYGWSSPIVAGGLVVITGDIGDDLVIMAFDLSGKPAWRATNGRMWKNPYTGARACCAFSEGRLYHMNAHGRVACLDAKTGQELWSKNVLDEFQGKNITWAMAECLLVDGPRLIVTPGGRKAHLAALDKTDGRVLWMTEPVEQDKANYASPILLRQGARRILVSCSSEHGLGIDADTGKILWSVPMKTTYDVTASTPVYGGGKVHFAAPYISAGCFRLLDDGAKVERAWATPFDTCTGSSILAEGVLYGGGYEKFRGWIAVDWNTGETRGALKEIRTGSAVLADGRLWVVAENGTAALVSLLPDGFKVVSQFEFAKARRNDAWAHPVLVDGRLYLRYHDSMTCFDVRAR